MSIKTRFGRPSIPGARGRKGRAPGRPRRPLRSLRRSGSRSPVAQLFQPILVDAEVVCELVQDRGSDLVPELLAILPERLFQRPPVDRDLSRQVRRLLEGAERIGLAGGG